MLRGMIVTSSSNKYFYVIDIKGRAFPSAAAYAATIMARVEIYNEYGFDIVIKDATYVDTLQKAILGAKLKTHSISKEEKEKIINAFISIDKSELTGLALESITEVDDLDYDVIGHTLQENSALNKKLNKQECQYPLTLL